MIKKPKEHEVIR